MLRLFSYHSFHGMSQDDLDTQDTEYVVDIDTYSVT